MSGGSTRTKSVQNQMVDPGVYSALWGAGTVQPIFDKKGRVKNQAEVDASRAAAAQSGGGLLGQAQTLAQQNPTGLNETQNQALTGITNYVTSPEALSGQKA